ncbi:transcription termination/antitermination protein NusA [bacterium]|nr:transcription termination/antitermination protein NusA [bacterium]
MAKKELGNIQIVEAMEEIINEKLLDADTVVQTLKDALLLAVKKKYGSADNVEVEFDPKVGRLAIRAKKKVKREVEDPLLDIDAAEAKALDPDIRINQWMWVYLDLATFGRNAIQIAKQILIQRIREAERENVFADFQHKIKEITSGPIQRIEKGAIIINLGRTEGVIPRGEQIPGERYSIGKIIRSLVLDVQKNPRGPQILLSRKSADFLRKLFEFEVPEIYEGRVEIVAIAREAGERSKIAVYSVDEKIDPVGACVGLKGTRVQSVVKELNNEKIDIIGWDSDPERFITRALAPATVLMAFLAADENHMIVVVDDDELSLAIGKGGQNARLAAKLTGWRITLFGREQYQSLLMDVKELPEVTPEQAKALHSFDIDTVQKLARMSVAALQEIPGIGEEAPLILADALVTMEDIGLEYGFVTDREALLIERGIDPEEERARKKAEREAYEARKRDEKSNGDSEKE